MDELITTVFGDLGDTAINEDITPKKRQRESDESEEDSE
jgi:hypothetical protein